jgi:DNA-binding NtrC family response regulator
MLRAIGKKGGVMLMILVASPDRDSLSELESALAEHDDVSLLRVESVNKTLDLASEKVIDLVIADERFGDTTGLELAARLLTVNPMITCSVVSGMTSEEFHEASEGLGIMAQLPIHPDKEHAESLLHRLSQIKNLTSGRN